MNVNATLDRAGQFALSWQASSSEVPMIRGEFDPAWPADQHAPILRTLVAAWPMRYLLEQIAQDLDGIIAELTASSSEEAARAGAPEVFSRREQIEAVLKASQ